MPVLYITSDRPAAGKTALASSLLAELSRGGRRVGYFKPFSASPQEDADVAFAAGSIAYDGGDIDLPPPLPVGEIGRGGQALSQEAADSIKRSVDRLLAAMDVVLVEGPSLSIAQGDGPGLSSRLAELLDARILLVVQYTRGMDAQQALRASGPLGDRLLGVLVNSVTRYRHREASLSLVPAIESGGAKVLGTVPEDRLMSAVTVGQIARALDGHWTLGREKADDLVENFLIGGNIMDWGITYFGRMENKAVIVRGNRPDIQMAALSTPTTCLILTGGYEPIQYVYYQAERQDVPLMVVQPDTISTAHAMDNVVAHSVFHHPRKLERFRALMDEHLDMAPIMQAV